MTRLLKYLRPYALLILVAVGLLFLQANADLALPDYMSRIVNNGIQQGGIENAVPLAIRQSEMDRLTLFLTADETTRVLASYTLIDGASAEYGEYLKQYPALAEGPVYILNRIDAAETADLNPILGKGLLVTYTIEQLLKDPEQAAAMAQSSGLDVSRIPPGMDLWTVLRMLPADARAQISDSINERFASLGESMITQMAVGAVKNEYAALGMNTEKLQTDYIVHTGILMLLLTLLSGACTVAVGFLSAQTAAGFARDLRRNVFARVEDFSSAEFDQFSTASLITRSTNDVTQIQMVVLMTIRMVFYAPIIGIGGVIRAVGKSADMWWIIALAVIVLFGLILTVFAVALPKFQSIQKLIDRLNLVVRENLSGMMVIRAFNRQAFEEERFDKANRDVTGTLLFINRIMVVMMPVMMMVMNGLVVLIIWVGAHQVAEARMQVGDMLAFMQYAMQIVFSFLMLSIMFIILPRAAVSADRIADVLGTAPSIRDPQNPRRFPEPFRGTVEFRDVCFRYPGAEEDVLHDISFTARPGETTAFIGTTGSGKSTIVSLIPRFYEVTDGAVLIDGVDVRAVTQSDLRGRIGYVPQKSNLFSGTIGSNLCYADPDASDEELLQAAEIAQAKEFITANPAGLEAEVAQGGANVSGGQKQRLAIARALVKKAPIYIFDDSFSSLDFKTDSALRKALRQRMAGCTLLLVTQRISTIMHAEQIVVLDEGRIAGKGTHAELLKNCEVYRGIAEAQLSKEELS
ncbi:MAG: ABC transporter ATP-binding protein [Anaerolineales bacterium]|nr:ABC transporter ATP-binding protein [Anaerolineales bacterium]